MAELLAAHSRVFTSMTHWNGLQRYVMNADRDSGLTRAERNRLMAAERKLKDEPEEYWRAYRLLRGVLSARGSQRCSASALNSGYGVCVRST